MDIKYKNKELLWSDLDSVLLKIQDSKHAGDPFHVRFPEIQKLGPGVSFFSLGVPNGEVKTYKLILSILEVLCGGINFITWKSF